MIAKCMFILFPIQFKLTYPIRVNIKSALVTEYEDRNFSVIKHIA